MITIGLTGGLGSGKSTVLDMCSEAGIPVLDADWLAHKHLAPGQRAYKKVVRSFGKKILSPDGAVNRAKLAAIVFKSPRDLARLNRIVHPPVIQDIKCFLRDCRRAGKTLCAVAVPLLYEAGLEKMFDVVAVVHARREKVLRRVARDRKMTVRDMGLRLKAQMSLDQKARQADCVLDNNKSLKHLQGQVRNWVDGLIMMSGKN